ncbi:histidine phosphatase family protein [Ruminococcus flavefaciens]|uniref:histidine phosphatase family protein n=1 Tax=Ruminococcus flavefaciens TaxID=1265 RepID=UPI0026F36686|nr:histidine phosphatase family protein [Ruminococcus flavefaciens]MDD7515688.1 histidine phosphatase family protein [Ruminococcus flavefaciens]MDY5690308.1 histidine phosphatase family protein [Ruminococcus flavefaciens]
MRIVFIRHGKTVGNTELRYIGRTDEPLSFSGIAELMQIDYPECGMLFCSPMKRCVQTAELIFPNVEMTLCHELRECDFGDFEGKNYIELSMDSRYQHWIDSGGEDAFPNGEDPAQFKKRCIDGFLEAVKTVGKDEKAVFVVHGGTIMAILEHFAVPHKGYYDWHISNGHGYITEFDGKNITVTEKI